MIYFDKIFNPKIVKKNNEFIWENEETKLLEKNNDITADIFDDWFNTYFFARYKLSC